MGVEEVGGGFGGGGGGGGGNQSLQKGHKSHILFESYISISTMPIDVSENRDCERERQRDRERDRETVAGRQRQSDRQRRKERTRVRGRNNSFKTDIVLSLLRRLEVGITCIRIRKWRRSGGGGG